MHSTAKRGRRIIALCGCLALSSAVAVAESPTPSDALVPVLPAVSWDKASIRLGAFFPQFDSSLGFPITAEDQVLISGEDTLGLAAHQSVFRGDALYRIGRARRHQLDASYASYRRSASTRLTDSIEVGGGVIIPATRVESVLNFDVVRLGYTYALLQTEAVRLAGGLSAYGLPVEYGLEVVVGDTPAQVKPRSLFLPVPALSLRADLRVWRQLYLSSEVNGIYLELAGFQGSLFEGGLQAEYRIWRHLTLGAGYQGMFVDVLSKGADADYPGARSLGELNVGLHGALVFARMTF